MFKIAVILTVLWIVFGILDNNKRPFIATLAGFFGMLATVVWFISALLFAWRL